VHIPVMAENHLLESMESLSEELRRAATFISNIHEVLEQKVPDTAQGLWNDLGRLSEQVLIEIEDQMGSLLAKTASYSAVTAATRLSDLAGGLEKQVEEMSLLADQISGLHIQLEDSQLNTLQNEYLQSSIRGLGRIVSFVKQIQPEDL
jgi:hypothetical protein